MIYLDASALLKLVIDEPESQALGAWLTERQPTSLVSSELAKVEVRRGVRRVNPDAESDARAVVDGLDLVPLATEVVDRASELGDPDLRSLDALHLASALALGATLTDFVVYDRRLRRAAGAAGFPTRAPGR